MIIRERWFERWKSDYAFKTVVTAFVSLLVTVLFALYNGFLGIYHGSVWYAAICLYYLLLAVLRGTVIAAEKKIFARGGNEKARDRTHLAASVLLLILNISMIGPITMMVTQQKPVDMTLIPAIVMAAYTTYKITMASVHLRRSSKVGNSLVRLLRTINFIDALVSILTLQNTLIMVSSKGDGMKLLPLSAPRARSSWLRPCAFPSSQSVTGSDASGARPGRQRRNEAAPGPVPEPGLMKRLHSQ